MRNCYFSKCYKESYSAGSKAKMDMEQIMQEIGFQNIGIRQTIHNNKAIAFLTTLYSVSKTALSLRQGDILVIQYPLKKYYEWLCDTAHHKGAKVITLIHDLGAFRRKKLTPEEEINRLRHSDYLITLNDAMTNWLREQGCVTPMGSLRFWDYLSPARPTERQHKANEPYTVIYAGALGRDKNRFLYLLDALPRQWEFCVYGKGLDEAWASKQPLFHYAGFIPANQLIAQAEGDFGLVWDGDSCESCTGDYGEYLRYNNPHKSALYIRCHLPLIVWRQSALAPFVERQGIGLLVDSLEELNDRLSRLSPAEYQQMRKRTAQLSEKLASGFFFRSALAEAIQCLTANIQLNKSK